MAILHRATLNPTKLDLIRSWVPRQPWCPVAAGELELVAAFRYDDPRGEVGVETHLVSTGSQILQVPLTYRAAPADLTEPALVGTTEHSVLGPRWVYDGCADVAYAAALATSLVTGSGQVEQWLHDGDAEPVLREPTMTITSTGTAVEAPLVESATSADDGPTTVILAGVLELVVVRVLDTVIERPADSVLTGIWPEHPEPAVLALARSAH